MTKCLPMVDIDYRELGNERCFSNQYMVENYWYNVNKVTLICSGEETKDAWR